MVFSVNFSTFISRRPSPGRKQMILPKRFGRNLKNHSYPSGSFDKTNRGCFLFVFFRNLPFYARKQQLIRKNSAEKNENEYFPCRVIPGPQIDTRLTQKLR
jgi:hypothetical protein